MLVTYFVLPDNDFAALVRRTTISNTGENALTLSALNGLAIIIGTWPLVLKIFQTSLKKTSFDNNSTLPGGGNMKIVQVRQESGTPGWVLIILTLVNVHSYILLNADPSARRSVLQARRCS